MIPKYTNTHLVIVKIRNNAVIADNSLNIDSLKLIAKLLPWNKIQTLKKDLSGHCFYFQNYGL